MGIGQKIYLNAIIYYNNIITYRMIEIESLAEASKAHSFTSMRYESIVPQRAVFLFRQQLYHLSTSALLIY